MVPVSSEMSNINAECTVLWCQLNESTNQTRAQKSAEPVTEPDEPASEQSGPEVSKVSQKGNQVFK